MGGHALGYESKRITPLTYFNLWEVISNILSANNFRAELTKSYDMKESFGDIDVIVQIDPNRDIRKFIEEFFKPENIVSNGNCISFDIDEFQIDFIMTPKECFDVACMYYSYNDMHGLIGIMVRKYGLSHGFSGLFVNYEFKGMKEKILVTRNPKEIMDLLGYDIDKMHCRTVQDIFDYVMSSPLAHPSHFIGLDGATRKRNANRTNMTNFIQWVVKQEKDLPYMTPELMFEQLIKKHPDVLDRIAEFDGECMRKNAIKLKFNGNLVSNWTGRYGEKLGELIKTFKASVDDQWILNATDDQIKALVLHLHSQLG